MRRKGYLPGGAGEALAILSHRLSTSILRYPVGTYGIVGSIPMELTEEARSATGAYRRSRIWQTEQEVIDALLAIGVTRFQRADCSWYEVK